MTQFAKRPVPGRLMVVHGWTPIGRELRKCPTLYNEWSPRFTRSVGRCLVIATTAFNACVLIPELGAVWVTLGRPLSELDPDPEEVEHERR